MAESQLPCRFPQYCGREWCDCPTDNRGRPLVPCSWCRGSRTDQVSTSYYTDEGEPLCFKCWKGEYEDNADAE